jgi:hypothetical protein
MTRRPLTALGRAVRENWTPQGTHFHTGPAGRAYPCTDPDCPVRRRSA